MSASEPKTGSRLQFLRIYSGEYDGWKLHYVRPDCDALKSKVAVSGLMTEFEHKVPPTSSSDHHTAKHQFDLETLWLQVTEVQRSTLQFPSHSVLLCYAMLCYAMLGVS